MAAILIALAMVVGPGRALAQRPLGTDVSGYQPSINWTTVKSAGVAFAWTKATEGTGYVNPDFTSQEAGAKGVGIYVGAYHFARPSSNPNITGANSADSEAAYFWATASGYVKGGGTYLVPMLDWEDTGATVAAGFTVTTMSAWVNEWCNAVSNYARLNGVPGIKPVVYTGIWYSEPSGTYPGLNSSVTIWPDWIAAYPTSPNPQTGGPSSSYPWSTWNIWQYADTNWSGGDSDVYNGTLSGFIQTFVLGGTNSPSITTAPTNITVAVDSSATFYSKASGQAPLTFKWLFNGTVIPGATSSNYTIAHVQLTNAGGYTVVVTNSYASVSAGPAFLSAVPQLTNANGCILDPSGIVDWWPAEGNPNDIYGGKNGTPQYGFSYAPGKQGLAFHFEGSTSYLTTGAASMAVPWTACFWVNRQDAPGPGAALVSDGNNELKLEQYNLTRKVGVTVFSGAGNGDFTFNYTAPVGTWVHLAFVGTSSGTTLYANGVSQGSITNSISLPRAYFGVGYVSSGGRYVDFMLGSLDEILMFNRALSSSEISAIYAAGSAGLVRVPQFTGPSPRSGNQFLLNLEGLTGKTFSIYRSPDFISWSRIATGLSNSSGIIQYIDTTATNLASFYRASQP